ncbi:MAG: type III-A CRISPR-associated RAMP protein Csm3 [Muribaculaceae bacterium]|nr:type III-A CRISPR-associated RAMP protein Csm3 [Muribaculaceae bacterium]
MKKLIKKIKINTTLEVLTGLHIGGNKESVEIGGIDNPVIKIATKKNQPYIPGSSLRGKMRCLLEQADGADNVGGSAKVNKLFGITESKDRKGLPSRLVVRDAMLCKDSALKLENSGLDMPYTEGKWENVIKRVEGTAENPRLTERVPAGAIFDVEFIINVFEEDDEAALKNLLKEGMDLLEADYLGGNGSRGYGQVKFGELRVAELSPENQWKQ